MTRVHLYHDPNTSEASGEWDTLAEALADAPCQSGASRLVSNGFELARVWFDGPERAWVPSEAGRYRLRVEGTCLSTVQKMSELFR